MNYGQKIAELRKGKNLTQAELGGMLNITAQAVSKWENDLSEPDINSIKKLCEIFEVSVDEFLGVSANEKSEVKTEEQPVESVKIINGYCDKCRKPVGPHEYRTEYLEYNSNSLVNKVSTSAQQHIYCNDCYKSLLDIERQERLAKRASQKAENLKDVRKGLICGTVFAVIVAIITFIFAFTNPSTEGFITASVLTIATFTFASQLKWDCWIADFFLFFCRSFSAPFGFIFELSLDGFLWLITVKLALWIICGILSFAFFLVGLVLSLALSVLSFGFVLYSEIQSA